MQKLHLLRAALDVMSWQFEWLSDLIDILETIYLLQFTHESIIIIFINLPAQKIFLIGARVYSIFDTKPNQILHTFITWSVVSLGLLFVLIFFFAKTPSNNVHRFSKSCFFSIISPRCIEAQQIKKTTTTTTTMTETGHWLISSRSFRFVETSLWS